MLNLLRMDLYRMLKFKRTWVLLIIALVGWFGMSFVTHVAYEDGLKLLSQTGSTRLLTDMQVPGAAIVGKHISFIYLLTEQFHGQILLILIAIFAVFFAGIEQSTGFIKGIAGQAPFRGALVLSKLIATAIFVLGMFIVSSIGMGIGCQISFGFVEWGGFAAGIPALGLQFLLHVAFASTMIMLVVLLRSAGISIVIGILAAAGTFNLVNLPVHALIKGAKDFNISNYLTSGNISLMDSMHWGSANTQALIVGILYLVISTVIGMVVMRARDVV